MKLSFIRDTNGNKKIKITTTKGSFSLQTLGNLPTAHNLNKEDLNNNKSQVIKEIKDYSLNFGTKRQKHIAFNI